MSTLKLVAYKLVNTNKWFWQLETEQRKILATSYSSFKQFRNLEYNACICVGQHPVFGMTHDWKGMTRRVATIDKDRSHPFIRK